MAVVCPQPVQRSRCPPSAAVRQRTMASNTFRCCQLIHLRLCSMNDCPAQRTMSAISREAGHQLCLCPPCGRERERIERAGGCAEMPLGQMQIDGRYLEVAMAEQDLDGAQVGAGFEKMCGEAVSQSVRMDAPVSRPARSAAIWQAVP
jgi:hypothetical protein